jgi:hypothetical protein
MLPRLDSTMLRFQPARSQIGCYISTPSTGWDAPSHLSALYQAKFHFSQLCQELILNEELFQLEFELKHNCINGIEHLARYILTNAAPRRM